MHMKNTRKKSDYLNTSLLNGTQVHARQYTPELSNGSTGLSSLQKSTSYILSHTSQWGFARSELNIKRYKLNQHTWRLTVVNPRTRKTILQADGHGDTVFANEDNLARMAETLMAQGLTIRTQFDE